MSSMTIQLDPVALREATTQAIMGILTPEVRAQLIQQSITAILKPSTDNWNRDKSPLQEAFNRAVQEVAQEEAKRVIAGDPVIALKLAQMLREVADKVLSTDHEKFVERMAESFVSSIKSRDY
jgi:FKBP-type peptidyl-prolyl cis-trans isomerase (trigger factor)